jgi:ferredoxin-thioredoxin reductase catalytic subunit
MIEDAEDRAYERWIDECIDSEGFQACPDRDGGACMVEGLHKGVACWNIRPCPKRRDRERRWVKK